MASFIFEAALAGLFLIPELTKLATPDNPSYTNVQIGVGLTSGPLSNDPDPNNLGGDTPSVHLFSEIGLTVGMYDGYKKGRIHAGTHKDIRVEHSGDNSNANPTYVVISQGGNDAICISYFKLTAPNGISYTVFGDTPAACDAKWYPSSSQVLPGADSGLVPTPRCFWLDGDGQSGEGENGLIYRGAGMHLPSLRAPPAQLERYRENIDLLCKSPPRYSNYKNAGVFTGHWFFNPPLSTYETSEDGVILDEARVLDVNAAWYPDCTPAPNEPVWSQRDVNRIKNQCPKKYSYDETLNFPRRRKRNNGTKPKTKFMAGELTVSEFPTHSAKEVCESKTSQGPDFISVEEGLMCDMGTREVWPLCKAAEEKDCFDMDSMIIRYADNGSGIQRRSEEYHTVRHWKV